MPFELPVFPGEPLYDERIRLEDRDYIFRFDWNARANRYYMSIYSADGIPLLVGIKVISNWLFLARSKWDARLPPGELLAVDLEQGGEPPTFNDFGTRVKLTYYDSTEDLT